MNGATSPSSLSFYFALTHSTICQHNLSLTYKKVNATDKETESEGYAC